MISVRIKISLSEIWRTSRVNSGVFRPSEIVLVANEGEVVGGVIVPRTRMVGYWHAFELLDGFDDVYV